MKPKMKLYWEKPSIDTIGANLGRALRGEECETITHREGHHLVRITLDLGDGERDIHVASLSATSERDFTCDQLSQKVEMSVDWEYEDVIL